MNGVHDMGGMHGMGPDRTREERAGLPRGRGKVAIYALTRLRPEPAEAGGISTTSRHRD